MKVLDVEIPSIYRRKLNGPRMVVGVDVESLVTGYAFLVCDSGGRHQWVRSFDDVVEFFSCDGYTDCLLVAYNLNFDAGVMLKWLGERVCAELIDGGSVSVGACAVEYVPSKYLRFRFGNRFVRIFDVAQYFKGGLDNAAKAYLNMSKLSMRSKTFVEADYGRRDLIAYCVRDAMLAQGLGEYVVTAFDKIGVSVQSLVSPANVLETYVLDQLGLRNSVWNVPEQVLEFAKLSFRGAWFENFKSGSFSITHRYDLVSAYPSVIRDLIDLSFGEWVQSVDRPSGAVYGYVHARVNVPEGCISPVAYKTRGGFVFYPHGEWNAYITMGELDWIREHGGSVRVLEGWWFVTCVEVFPYRSVVDKFFGVKAAASPGSMERWSAKMALVGMYGKFLQHRGSFAGRLYNPVYATEVTSRVRLRVADACLTDPGSIIAVMSDCVVSDRPLDLFIGKGIGDWDELDAGRSLWLGSVQYEAAGRDKRFRHISWRKLLEEDPKSADYTVMRKGPLTLVQGVRLNRFEDVGVWVNQSVTFNVRRLSYQRFWPKRPVCGRDLLTSRYDSRQLSVGSRLGEEDVELWSL